VLTTSSQTTPPAQTREVPFATAELELGGMHCSARAARIERALGRLPGVANAPVNLATARAFVSYNGSAISAGELCQTVAEVGYIANTVDAVAGSARRQHSDRGCGTLAAVAVQAVEVIAVGGRHIHVDSGGGAFAGRPHYATPTIAMPDHRTSEYLRPYRSPGSSWPRTSSRTSRSSRTRA
jgi:copper chaperone CopZ